MSISTRLLISRWLPQLLPFDMCRVAALKLGFQSYLEPRGTSTLLDSSRPRPAVALLL